MREKGTRIGGSMLLSSGVIWRHRDWDEFRRECPGGDERLQRLVWERLDEALEWLESKGAPVVWEETGNPRTVGKRFEPRGLATALAGDVELGVGRLRRQPAILCTGGFAASSGARDALHRARGVAAAAREPVVGGRRPVPRARPRAPR